MGLDNRWPISSQSAPLKSDTPPLLLLLLLFLPHPLLEPLVSGVMLNSLPKFSELMCSAGREEEAAKGTARPSGHQPEWPRITNREFTTIRSIDGRIWSIRVRNYFFLRVDFLEIRNSSLRKDVASLSRGVIVVKGNKGFVDRHLCEKCKCK